MTAATVTTRLRRALDRLDVAGSHRVGWRATDAGTNEIVVELSMTEPRAVLLADQLDADVVDRVEVAAVVETLVDLHTRTLPLGESPCCVTCLEPAPCATRRLLAQLPGGAL